MIRNKNSKEKENEKKKTRGESKSFELKEKASNVKLGSSSPLTDCFATY